MPRIPFTVDLPLDPEPGEPEDGPRPDAKPAPKRTGERLPRDTDKSAERLPRDTDKSAGRLPRDADPSDEPAVYSVTRLTREIRQVLESALGTVVVEGEVSNFKAAASGHWYFNLKDEGAQIRCIMFRQAAQGVRFQVEDGLQVRVRGRVTVYEARGEYQIQALVLEPQGVGALQLAFEQLKAKLEAEGLFDPARKRPLPFLPRGIGIVTSPQGAAIRDMLTVLERRFPGLPVLIYPARVQGAGAAQEIAAGIAALGRLAEEQALDVLIVGRGGGSVEDLWAFNEEAVARAIHASRVPVISAVGHEVDFTIADFVADMRAPTPSAAAELAVPNRADLLAAAGALRTQLVNRVRGWIERLRERRESLRARLSSPEAGVYQLQQRLDDLSGRLQTAQAVRLRQIAERVRGGRDKLLLLRPDRLMPQSRETVRGLERRLRPALRTHLARLRERLEAQAGLLDSLSPLTVLGRGYAVLLTAAGKPLRSVRQAAPGDALAVRLHDGGLDTRVEAVHPEPKSKTDQR
jgi:exodeoxyribonuclease VII large subunit